MSPGGADLGWGLFILNTGDPFAPTIETGVPHLVIKTIAPGSLCRRT